MVTWYEAARKHIKSVLPPSAATAHADLMAAWFTAGAPGAAGAQPLATTAVAGSVKKMPAQVNTTATGTDVPTLATDFNALLAKLRTAGILT